MNIKALAIYLGRETRVGILFQFAPEGAAVINRFEADPAFRARTDAPVLSTSFLADAPQEQQALWSQITAAPFNGRYSPANGWLLPGFFQNLLPEGVFRDQVAALRGCDPRDHFEMLAACGKDLPGNIYALPVELSRDELAHYITQDQDALEMTVTADPLDEGMSLSGVQPKLGVMRQGDRYVGRTRDHDSWIIAKLPVVGMALLPEVEELSLRLAAAAGVSVCEAYLEPLDKLAAQHGYDLGQAGGSTRFLAVVRYDRSPQGRIHAEDFAQILGAMPEEKYGGAVGERHTYLSVAAVLLDAPSMGEAAVHELLRRLLVNELLGNPDMHLKNIGLQYPDGRTPEFPPAYDIVAYAAFNRNQGHALPILPAALAPKLPRAARTSVAGQGPGPSTTAPADLPGPRRQQLSPAVVRAFCAALDIPEKPATAALATSAKAAHAQWPQMIEQSLLTPLAKTRLLAQFRAHPMVQSLERRKTPASSNAGSES